MTFNLYAIRDVYSGFGAPFAERDDRSAVRGFSYSINHDNGLMNFQPKDFSLFGIGKFDTVKGTIEAYDVPVMIVEALSLVSEDA